VFFASIPSINLISSAVLFQCTTLKNVYLCAALFVHALDYLIDYKLEIHAGDEHDWFFFAMHLLLSTVCRLQLCLSATTAFVGYNSTAFFGYNCLSDATAFVGYSCVCRLQLRLSATAVPRLLATTTFSTFHACLFGSQSDVYNCHFFHLIFRFVDVGTMPFSIHQKLFVSLRKY